MEKRRHLVKGALIAGMLLAAIALASVPLASGCGWFCSGCYRGGNRYRNGLAAPKLFDHLGYFRRSGGSDIDVWDCQIPRVAVGPPVFGAVGFGQAGLFYGVGVVTAVAALLGYLLIDSKMLASAKSQ